MTNLEIGKHLKSTYVLAKPYPHIIFDDFIPKDLAKQCYNNMTTFNSWGYDNMLGYSEELRTSQINKYFTPSHDDSLKDIELEMPVVWKTLQYFNSPTFLKFLSNLTGIDDLIADEKFSGGGCHMIKNGGRLEIHSDYNKHHATGMYRRVNLLLYLTPNWTTKHGGHLELWNKDPLTHVKSILPSFNRAVIFNTTDDALHGHPNPLDISEDEARYSIALYYFTKDRPDHEKSDSKAAIWYTERPTTPYL
tara:strand:- start:10137 stop:10883 length:747 start_codon:yes stop_codon:yes gene_type:complete